MFEERVKSSIAVGKFADFIVLAADPLAMAPETIKDIAVELTVVGGQIVYGGNQPASGARRRAVLPVRQAKGPEPVEGSTERGQALGFGFLLGFFCNAGSGRRVHAPSHRISRRRRPQTPRPDPRPVAHLILEVTDAGTRPDLTSYRRGVFMFTP